MKNSKALQITIPGAVMLPANASHVNRMEIKSESSNRLYIVAQSRSIGNWQCSCPSWIYQRLPLDQRKPCKHLNAMMPMLEQLSAQKQVA